MDEPAKLRGEPNRGKTMEMHQVRYFLAACDSLNFTRAAEGCHVSQPALTTAIKKLEDDLGSPLFHREGKRMLLTDFGQLMRPHLEQVLGQAETARSVAQNFHLLNQAPLGVGVMATIGPLRLSRFLARFQRDHAGVEVSVSEGLLDDLTARLDKGDLELAVLSAPEGLDERFRTRPLYKERYVVVFPPDHRMKDMDAIRLGDLSGEPTSTVWPARCATSSWRPAASAMSSFTPPSAASARIGCKAWCWPVWASPSCRNTPSPSRAC